MHPTGFASLRSARLRVMRQPLGRCFGKVCNMESNFPSATYWYTSVIIAITVAVIVAIITRLIDEKISWTKAIKLVGGSIVFIAFSYIVLFYGVGQVYLMRADYLARTEGCGSAASVYQSAIIWLPSNGDAQVKYATCMSRIKQYDNALKFLDKLEERENGKYTYWWARSVIYFSQRDYSSLLSTTSTMLSLNPDTSAIVVDMAKELHSNFRRAEAEALLRNVRVYDDSNSEAIFWLAWALFEQQKYYDAMYHFDLCLSRFTSGYEAARCHAGKGFIFSAQNLRGNAIAEFNAALSIFPGQEDVQNALNQLLP